MVKRRPPRAPNCAGFTYLWLLFVVAVMGMGVVSVSQLWVNVAEHDNAVQRAWAGAQFIRAVGSYYHAVPDARAYPPSLDALLEDRRFAVPRRHLREVYRDPGSGQGEWTVISAAGGGIKGVQSRGHADSGTFVYEPLATDAPEPPIR